MSASEYIILSTKDSVFNYIFSLLGLDPKKDQRNLSKISINFYIFAVDKSYLNTGEQTLFITQILKRYECLEEDAIARV
jgi:hypothetical protein